jgi:uncharacterized protein (DUF697 family)
MPSTQEPSSAQNSTTAVEPAKTDAEREVEATRLVDRFTLWSGAAGLIPLPLVDIATVGGVQIEMVRRLSQIYGVPFAENRGKSIVASIAGSLLPASAATSTTMTIASMLKFLPGIGTTVAVISMPAFSACATWVIGKVFMKHFASGGTLLDFELPDYREFIKTQREKFQSRRSSAAAPTGGAGASAKPAAATKQ